MASAHSNGKEIRLTLHNRLDGSREYHGADLVILCTGFVERLPGYLDKLQERLHLDEHGRLRLGSEFDVQWDGPKANRIYGLNIGRFTHGIAEPQLSLAAWRSAVIINHLLGRPWFNVEPGPALVRWSMVEEPREQALEA
jgi:lysine N6-hydroxylase